MAQDVVPDESLHKFHMGPAVDQIVRFKGYHTVEQDGRHAHIWLKKNKKHLKIFSSEPYMVKKKTIKNLLLQNQESFEYESWYMASRSARLAKFV